MQLRQQSERLQAEIEELVVDHQQLMQRQTEEGAAYERRIEAAYQEVNGLRKQLQSKDSHIS